MKKNTAIVLGGTSNMSFAMGTFLINLKKCSPNLADDIIIYHDNISKNDQNIMKNILPVKFYNFKLNFEMEYVDEWTKNRFTDLVFYKYECLKLLNEYKTVIATDYDVVILSDISEILIPNNENIQCKTIRTPANFVNSKEDKRGNFSFDILEEPSFKYSLDTYPMGGGLIVFYDTIKNNNEIYNYCMEKTKQYSKYLLLPEQAIFSIMLHDFNIIREEIDRNIYVVHPNNQKNCPNAKILHAHGDDKFWDKLQNDIWDKNYKEWLDMGGSDKNYYKNMMEHQKEKNKKIIDSISWWIPIKYFREKFRNHFNK